MTPFAWLLGLVLPACGAVGAQGLPVPPFDPAHIVRPATHNTALAAPAGVDPTPDVVTPVYAVPADRLYAAIRAVAASEPRTFLAAEDSHLRHAHYVVRSAVFNFPDLVAVAVAEAGPGSAALIIWSRSVYGRSDLGVNRSRVAAWIASLDRQLAAP